MTAAAFGEQCVLGAQFHARGVVTLFGVAFAVNAEIAGNYAAYHAISIDQGFLGGLGNYLRSEILFVARLHPTLRPIDCTTDQIAQLAAAAIALPWQSYETAGITNDLQRRLFEHREQTSKCAHTTRYRTNRLVYFEVSETAYVAIAREKQLKGWLRARKVALIEEANPTWDDLANQLFS